MKPAAFLPLFLLIGCASMETRSYDVTVRNDSIKPVTVWLTKNGPAWEPGWKSPEDLAIESPGSDEPIAGVIVPAGKTAITDKVSGKFAHKVDAILRVYLGQKRFNELLAVNRGSPDRIDIVLSPGENLIVVADDGGGVKAERVER